MRRLGPTPARGTMAKSHRTNAPPPGADLKLRNTRLYGGMDEQIATAALRARGCPNPNRTIVTRKRADLVRERDMSSHTRHLQRAQDEMLSAQRAVRAARLTGQPTADLAQEARIARARYLKLNGGVERREVEVAVSASSWDEAK